MKELEFTVSITKFQEVISIAKQFGTKEQYKGACGAIRMIIGSDELEKIEKSIENIKMTFD